MRLTKKDILLTLTKAPNLTLQGLCSVIKPSPEYIIDVLQLGRLNEQCLEAVQTNSLTITAAFALAKLSHAEQILAHYAARTLPANEFVTLVTSYLAEKNVKKRRR